VCLQYFDTVGWVLRPVKNRRPYNLYCVGGDVKPCSINQSIRTTLAYIFVFAFSVVIIICLYGYNDVHCAHWTYPGVKKDYLVLLPSHSGLMCSTILLSLLHNRWIIKHFRHENKRSERRTIWSESWRDQRHVWWREGGEEFISFYFVDFIYCSPIFYHNDCVIFAFHSSLIQ